MSDEEYEQHEAHSTSDEYTAEGYDPAGDPESYQNTVGDQ